MRAVFVMLLLAPAAAFGQVRPAPRPPAPRQAETQRFRVSINFGIEQPAATTFDVTTTKTVNLETARFTTTYDAPRGQMFDGGVLVRIAGGFGVGAAVSAFSKSSAGAVTGTVPHPFFFNTQRPLSGSAASLSRSETAVHVLFGYVAASKHVDVAISGGPTFFNVSQDLVSDVAYTEAYPYDTVTFGSATVSKVTATKAGFNVGGDVAYKFSKNVGVGGLIRYSKASANFALAGTASGVTTDVGGMQAGGGVRFYF